MHSKSLTYAVQMERVSIVIFRGSEANLDGLSSGEDKGVFSHVEVFWIGSTINDFFESRHLRCEVRDSVDVPLSLASGLKTNKRENHFIYREKINDWRLERTMTRSKVRETSGSTTLVGTRGRRSASTRAPSVGPEVIGVVGSRRGAPAYRKIARERVPFSSGNSINDRVAIHG